MKSHAKIMVQMDQVHVMTVTKDQESARRRWEYDTYLRIHEQDTITRT